MNLTAALTAANRQTVHNAGPRYSPSLDPHAPNILLDSLLDAASALSLGNRVRDRLSTLASSVRKAYPDHKYLRALFHRKRVSPLTLAADLESVAAEVCVSGVVAGVVACRRRLLLIRRPVLAALEQTYQELEDSRASEGAETTTSDARSRVESRRESLIRLSDSLEDVDDFLNGTEGSLLADRNAIFLVGPWGSGKTHFVCDVASSMLAEGIPALVVLAANLRDDIDPLSAVAEATGLCSTGKELVDLLDAAGHAAGRRAIVLIDGINEADRLAWRARLTPLALQAARSQNFGLIVTCRSPFDDSMVTRPAARLLVRLEHPGFEEREFDAQQEFFTYYGLPVPQVPLLTPEFSRPLFLRVLCEALSNLSTRGKHKQLTSVASGQKGMTYVLEYFAKEAGARVEKRWGLPAKTCWLILKGQPTQGRPGIAGAMAASGRAWVSRTEAEQAVQAESGLSAPDTSLVTSELVSEGLLAEDQRYLKGSYTTVLVFPYQRFGNHIVARHLLEKHLNVSSDGALKRCLYKNRPLGAIFTLDRWGRQYSDPGLASAIMLEFPERVKRLQCSRELIHHLPRERRLVSPFVNTFLDGLYWRQASAINQDTVRVVDRLLSFDNEDINRAVYETLVALATRPSHLLSASSLWDRLRSMTMPGRDLLWSEFLRLTDERSSVRRHLAWTERVDRPLADEVAAANEMLLLASMLTTTDRPLRDRCTRALVKIGLVHPQQLFALVEQALNFNDPYVPERVLAASYGVAMRRWAVEGVGSAFARALEALARRLLSTMLRDGSAHATCHTLMRGYAVGIVEISRMLKPWRLSASDRSCLSKGGATASSPFRPIESISARAEKEGESAIHMDFGNYTLGSLVQDRGNYQFNHPEYAGVRKQIADRIVTLGYSAKLFGEIDKRIAHSSWRQNDGNKVDRYGKKYSWIAYFEMYGIREVDSLVKRAYLERTTNCDIDPSFPETPRAWRAPSVVAFGQTADAVQWLSSGPMPNISNILNPEEVDGESGPWVLLHAWIKQRSQDRREVSCAIWSALASKANIAKLHRELNAGRWAPDHGFPRSREDYYTYHGEVPWSRRFGLDVRTTRGTPRRLSDHAFNYYAKGRWRRGIPVEVPYRDWLWESYHSSLNPGGPVTFPSPAIASFLKLRLANGSSDLMDESGRLATLYRVSEGDFERCHYLYLRKDLLDRYLAYRNLELARVAWGQRDISLGDSHGPLPKPLQQVYETEANRFQLVISA